MRLRPRNKRMEPQQPKPLEITPEDEARILERRALEDAQIKISEEAMLIAELGLMYGYEAVRAARSDQIPLEDVQWLVLAGRKVEARHEYNNASAMFTAVASANAKTPAKTFKQSTKQYIKIMRADI